MRAPSAGREFGQVGAVLTAGATCAGGSLLLAREEAGLLEQRACFCVLGRPSRAGAQEKPRAEELADELADELALKGGVEAAAEAEAEAEVEAEAEAVGAGRPRST